MKSFLALAVIFCAAPAFGFDAGGIVQNVVSQNNAIILQQQQAAAAAAQQKPVASGTTGTTSTSRPSSGSRTKMCPDGVYVGINEACPDPTKPVSLHENNLGIPAFGSASIVSQGEAALKAAGILRGVAGAACLCAPGFTMIGMDRFRPVYDYKEIGIGDGKWCYKELGAESFNVAPCLVPQPEEKAEEEKKKEEQPRKTISFTLDIALDTKFENEAACLDTMERALRVANKLIPAGAKGPVSDRVAYCKSLFPAASSPAVDVTMASQITVTSLEECVTRLNTAKGYSVNMKYVADNALKEVDDVVGLCQDKFLLATQGGAQVATDDDESTSLDLGAIAQKVSIGGATASVCADGFKPVEGTTNQCETK